MRSLARVSIISVLLNLLYCSSGVAQKNASAGQEIKASASQRVASWSRLSDRLQRRAACKQQATERGLSGRMARRYTRLCLSGLPVPKPIRRPP
jgi:hypothetical protein